jgi:hypothetical protein
LKGRKMASTRFGSNCLSTVKQNLKIITIWVLNFEN